MLDDKDEFDPNNTAMALMGRIAITNLSRWATGVAHRKISMPEKFKADTLWLKEIIMKWTPQIDAELRSKGLL